MRSESDLGRNMWVNKTDFKNVFSAITNRDDGQTANKSQKLK